MSATTKLAPADLKRLERIAGQCEEADAEWLRNLLLDRRQAAVLRLAQRDDLVREAIDKLDGLPPTRAADMLAKSIDLAIAAPDASRAVAGTLADFAFRIAELSNWRSLGARRIYQIFRNRNE